MRKSIIISFLLCNTSAMNLESLFKLKATAADDGPSAEESSWRMWGTHSCQ